MELPITISNIHGEELTFERIEKNENGIDILMVTNVLKPKSGPPMHVHFKQDESLTVTSGTMGYMTIGESPKYVEVGETVTFYAGTPHKFWNEGETLLKCTGWVSPPNTLIYFLSEMYKSMNKNNGRPGTYDAAFLMNRYKDEYDMMDIPAFVKKVIMPISQLIGNLTGKYKKYAGAPEPI